MISEKEYQERLKEAAGKPHMKVIPVPRMNEKQILKARNAELAIKVEELEFEKACLLEELREREARETLCWYVSFWNDERNDEEWKK